MSVSAVRPAPSTAPPGEGIRPRRWTRDEYYRAAERGVFGPEERLELLDGEILEKMTQLPPHACSVVQATQVLPGAFGPDHHGRTQLPVILNDASEPEPDVVVVPGTAFDYLSRHPVPDEVRLLLEVADSTLRFDRGRKRSAYARAGIREYWILNLIDRQLEVHRSPSGGRYRSITIYAEHESVTPLAAPDVTIRVADLLPPAASA